MRIKFTGHATRRMKKRGILKQEVIDIINYPDKITKKHGKLFYIKNTGRGEIEIATDAAGDNLKIITLYWP